VPTRSRQYRNWVYSGCSTQSVPSWSNSAMRSSGGTNFELFLSVVVLTKSIIACLAGPLFHDGSGSPSRAKDGTLKLPAAMIAADPFIKSLRVISIASPSWNGNALPDGGWQRFVCVAKQVRLAFAAFPHCVTALAVALLASFIATAVFSPPFSV